MIEFTEISLKSCFETRDIRKKYDIKYKDVTLPDVHINELYGYHKICHQRFTAIPPKQRADIAKEKKDVKKKVLRSDDSGLTKTSSTGILPKMVYYVSKRQKNFPVKNSHSTKLKPAILKII